MSGAEKIKALLKARGFDIQSFAGKRGHWPQNVSKCIHGLSERPEIRDDLAEELGRSRKFIDQLIGPAPKEANP